MIQETNINIYSLVQYRMKQPKRKPEPPDNDGIINAVCEVVRVKRADINMSAGRGAELVLARHLPVTCPSLVLATDARH